MKNIYIKKAILLLASVFTLSTSFAHWTTKGPYGGSVTCFAMVDTNIYVGTADGGVYRSVNTLTAAWRYANYVGLTTGHINALTGLGNYVIAGTSDEGIFVSQDIGASWTMNNTGLTNWNVQSLTSVNGKIFAGTDGAGVFMSSDSGYTWSGVNTGLTNLDINVLECDPSTGAVIAGTNGGGLFVTIDNGNSWTAINPGLTDLNILSFAMSGTTMITGTAGGVFTASTVAPPWTPANTGLTSTQLNDVHAEGGVFFGATPSGIFSTPDNNINWMHLNNGVAPASATAITGYNAKLFAGTAEDGIYSATPATTTWSAHNNGFNNLQSYALYNSGNLIVTSTNKGVFVSRDLASTYVASNSGLTDSLHVLCFAWTGSTLVAGTKNDGVFMSQDTGMTWTAVNTGLVDLNVRDIVFTNTYALAITGSGSVFINPWTTMTWSPSTAGLPVGMTLTCAATVGFNVYIGTSGNGIYHSTDGLNWTDVSSGLLNTNVTDLAVSGNNIYASTFGGGIFKNNISFPTAWTDANIGLNSMDILSLCASGPYILAGYKGTVQATDNGAVSWLPFGTLDYIPDYADVRNISFTPTSPRIFISTPDNSLYSNSISEMPVGIKELNADERFELYPNPSTGLFSLKSKDASVTIESVSVKDIGGKIVKQLTAGKNNQYQITEPKGLYLLEVKTDEGVYTQKIVLQ